MMRQQLELRVTQYHRFYFIVTELQLDLLKTVRKHQNDSRKWNHCDSRHRYVVLNLLLCICYIL